MTPEDLEYYINWIDKTAVGFERIDFNLERCSTVGKMLSNSISCYNGVKSMWQTLLSSFKKLLPLLQQPLA